MESQQSHQQLSASSMAINTTNHAVLTSSPMTNLPPLHHSANNAEQRRKLATSNYNLPMSARSAGGKSWHRKSHSGSLAQVNTAATNGPCVPLVASHSLRTTTGSSHNRPPPQSARLPAAKFVKMLDWFLE